MSACRWRTLRKPRMRVQSRDAAPLIAHFPASCPLSPLRGARGKKAAGLALAVALLAARPADAADGPPDPAALAQARGVVAASMVRGAEEQMIGAMSAGVAELILSVNPGKEADIGPVVEAYFTPLLREHFSELSDVPAAEFARSFSPAELDQLLAFYR